MPYRHLQETLYAIALLELQEHLDPVGHFPKGGKSGVQVRLGRERDEELAAARLGTLQGHSDHAPTERLAAQLVSDRVPRAAPAIPSWVASLNHEIGHDTMELQTVVELLVDQLQEVQTSR